MPITGHRGVRVGKGVGVDDTGAYFARWPVRSDVTFLKHLKTKSNTYRPMEMCQHGKTNMSIYKISEYCKKTGLIWLQFFRIWCKKYLSDESGGERKNFLALTLVFTHLCLKIDSKLGTYWKYS